MEDTKLIEELQKNEYNTGVIVRDTKGNEYTINNISLTMGGQFHQVIEIEQIPYEDNFFRDINQRINDCYKAIEDYQYAIDNNTFDGEHKEKFVCQMKKQIQFQENLIEHYMNEDLKENK